MNVLQLLFISLFICVLGSNPLYAQENPKKGHLFIEAGGVAGFGSLNYEHFLFKKGFLQTSFRAGISSIHLRDFRKKFNPDFIIPISFNCILGGTHAAELGVGNTLVSSVIAADYTTAERVSNNHAGFGIVYRYSAKSSPLIIRIGYTPLLEHYTSWRHWAGASIGIRL